MGDRTIAPSSANAARRGYLQTLAAITNTHSAGLLSDPGLRIDGGAAAAVAEAETAFYALAGGVLRTVAAGTNLPALVGTVANGDFGLFLWTINAAGTVTQAPLATGATLAAITFPPIPADEAIVGALLINPTGTGDFVGGTTDLDDATVVPGAVFFDGHNMAIGDRVTHTSGGSPGF